MHRLAHLGKKGSTALLRLSITTVVFLFISAHYTPRSEAQANPDGASTELLSDNLDGFYIALAPVAFAVRAENDWDGGFGGEVLLVRIRERSMLTAAGLGIGASRYAREPDRGLGRGTGRLWADLQIASRLPTGTPAGLSVGVATEVDPVIPARWGAQATLWAFVGVIPFVRVGVVQKNGTYIDFGIKVALPVMRI